MWHASPVQLDTTSQCGMEKNGPAEISVSVGFSISSQYDVVRFIGQIGCHNMCLTRGSHVNFRD